MVNREKWQRYACAAGRAALYTVATALAVLVAGCAVANARTLAVNEAARLRQMLNAADYAGIYASAGPEFRRALSEQKWIALCTDARRKLGGWKTSTLKDTQVIIVDSGGYIVGVDSVTEFENGSATENVSFSINNGQARLRSYTLSSPTLSRIDSAESP